MNSDIGRYGMAAVSAVGAGSIGAGATSFAGFAAVDRGVLGNNTAGRIGASALGRSVPIGGDGITVAVDWAAVASGATSAWSTAQDASIDPTIYNGYDPAIPSGGYPMPQSGRGIPLTNAFAFDLASYGSETGLAGGGIQLTNAFNFGPLSSFAEPSYSWQMSPESVFNSTFDFALAGMLQSNRSAAFASVENDYQESLRIERRNLIVQKFTLEQELASINQKWFPSYDDQQRANNTRRRLANIASRIGGITQEQADRRAPQIGNGYVEGFVHGLGTGAKAIGNEGIRFGAGLGTLGFYDPGNTWAVDPLTDLGYGASAVAAQIGFNAAAMAVSFGTANTLAANGSVRGAQTLMAWDLANDFSSGGQAAYQIYNSGEVNLQTGTQLGLSLLGLGVTSQTSVFQSTVVPRLNLSNYSWNSAAYSPYSRSFQTNAGINPLPSFNPPTTAPGPAIPGDAGFIGPHKKSWTLTAQGAGAHLVERANVSGRSALRQFDQPGTPRFYPSGSPENAGAAHIRLHRATKNAGIKLRRGGNSNLSDAELLQRYRQASSDPALDGIRGDVRTPDGSTVIGTNVTPSEALNLLLQWGG